MSRFVLAIAMLCAACSGSLCTDGTCTCPTRASCDFMCTTPPCHVMCEGQNPECMGACANGTCTCGTGSVCDFECTAPPCHVACQGTNASCTGACANGMCQCGTN